MVVPPAVRDSGGMAQPMHTPSRTVEGAAADELLFGELSLWGVLYLAFAALQLCATVLIIRRNASGAVIGSC